VPEAKLTVIQNWAPLDEFPQSSRRNGWSSSCGLGERPVLLYSGTLGMKHRPDLIYRLAQELGNLCTVVVVTEGVGEQYLKRQPALDNLILVGFQAYEVLPQVLASADVLLATLESDAAEFAVPSKILTYLCAGRPILLAAPAENLASSIVKESGAGLVVDPDNFASWADAAKRLVLDATYREELSMAARSYAERTFDITAVAASFEAILTNARYADQRGDPGAVAVTQAISS
jgi:glycosyltransferase involved in cell wall biosynthesis